MGLPRAGSTLIEQILASHSRVEGTMELSDIPRLAQSLQGRESRAEQPRYPGVLAEIVDNPLPKERARADVHRHPLYYAVRNHIIDFLVSRSRSFAEREGAGWDPRKVPVVRPGVPEPTLAAAAPSRHAALEAAAR